MPLTLSTRSGSALAGEPESKGGAGSYSACNCSASYTLASLVVDLAIKNLSDEEYFERLNYLGGRVTPAASRAVYLSLRASF